MDEDEYTVMIEEGANRAYANISIIWARLLRLAFHEVPLCLPIHLLISADHSKRW